MSNLELIVSGLDNATVRKTVDGRYSVYDAIGLCGAKNPRATFQRLGVVYPEYEVVTKPDAMKIDSVRKPDAMKIDSYKFKRKDGKIQAQPSPVANKQTILEIIGLLPGKLGKSYRAAAAELVVKYLEADLSIAQSVIERTKDLEGLKDLRSVFDLTIAKLEAAGLPHGRIEIPLDVKLYDSDMRTSCKSCFHHDRKLNATFFRQPGSTAWRIDADTPSYQDYSEWNFRFYPKDGLPLEKAIAALQIIRRERMA
jgi:hypothetical protein